MIALLITILSLAPTSVAQPLTTGVLMQVQGGEADQGAQPAAAPADGQTAGEPAVGADDPAAAPTAAAPPEGAALPNPAEGAEAAAEGAEAAAEGAEAAAEGADGAAAEGGEGAAPAAEEAKAELTEADFDDAEPGTFWMPPAANIATDDVDWLFYGILALGIFCFVAITIVVVVFTWKYRKRPGHKAEPSDSHNDVLEITWTVIPSIICVFIFIWGWQGFLNLNTPPKHAMEVGVVAQKWNWSFTYTYGQETIVSPELHVPVDEPVRLVMRSEDVLHSLYVPAFRVKQDVIPSRYTKLWFKPSKVGRFRLYCTEYCGQGHSSMKTSVVVHEPGGLEKWMASEIIPCDEEFSDPAKIAACQKDEGLELYEGRGCKQCHSLDGSSGTGPSFQGMWGSARQFSDGSSGSVDENYIRESVLDPAAKVRAGFNPVMPTFKGKLTDKQIDSIIIWMKTL